jgi:tetratricopeptide (TPR) repeat protein
MSLGELASSAVTPARTLSQPALLVQKLEEWKRERSLSFATDLLASAIVTGDVSDARDAAEFVLSPDAHASEAAMTVARRVIAPLMFDYLLDPISEANREHQRSAIRAARARTRSDTRNALAWVDLSLAYASLGFLKKAVETMDIALALAPTNRFVLRSAARLFVHTHEFDRARWILRSAPNLKSDPWLMAAEIAVSEVSHVPSRLVKAGARLIEASVLPPFHLTEIASAVGTLDLQAGNARSARKLFARALKEPTDNSLAQASWVSRTSRIITVDPVLLETPRSFEARTREHLRNSEWDAAFVAALEWMDDEPFAAGPAILASHIASSVLDDFEEALRILKIARIANRPNWVLTNNVAFCLASMGRVDEAAEEFSGIDPTPDDPRKIGTLLATRGLIEFRRGNPATGRALYLGAIDHFVGHEHRNSRAIAALFLAREEAVAQTTATEEAVKRARDLADKADSPEVPVLLDRIEKLAASVAGSPSSVASD